MHILSNSEDVRNIAATFKDVYAGKGKGTLLFIHDLENEIDDYDIKVHTKSSLLYIDPNSIDKMVNYVIDNDVKLLTTFDEEFYVEYKNGHIKDSYSDFLESEKTDFDKYKDLYSCHNNHSLKVGYYVNGLKVSATIVSFLIILPMLGIENVNQLVKWLIKLNSICMPLRYLWVFIAYILLKVKSDKFTSDDFVFVKNRKLGIAIGVWCFFVTAASCIMGMYSKNTFELVTNILTPIVLVLSGFMLPAINKIIRNKKSKI